MFQIGKTKDSQSPPPGWYNSKFNFVLKRPQSNMFGREERFKNVDQLQSTYELSHSVEGNQQ